MQEGIALVTDIDEAGIEAGHELPDFRQVHVAHGVGNALFLLLILRQALVLCQRYGDLLRLYVNVQFACYVHSSFEKMKN